MPPAFPDRRAFFFFSAPEFSQLVLILCGGSLSCPHTLVGSLSAVTVIFTERFFFHREQLSLKIPIEHVPSLSFGRNSPPCSNPSYAFGCQPASHKIAVLPPNQALGNSSSGEITKIRRRRQFIIYPGLFFAPNYPYLQMRAVDVVTTYIFLESPDSFSEHNHANRAGKSKRGNPPVHPASACLPV